jgi:hypothetical protein
VGMIEVCGEDDVSVFGGGVVGKVK